MFDVVLKFRNKCRPGGNWSRWNIFAVSCFEVRAECFEFAQPTLANPRSPRVVERRRHRVSHPRKIAPSRHHGDSLFSMRRSRPHRRARLSSLVVVILPLLLLSTTLRTSSATLALVEVLHLSSSRARYVAYFCQNEVMFIATR